MSLPPAPDFRMLDKPDILSRLFHPRPDLSPHTPGLPLMIPVAEDIRIGACFHMAGKGAPNVLFFHGNGEIVSDYNDIAPLYTKMGINFLPVDYRGYGRSGGTPTLAHMIGDSHTILDFTTGWLRQNAYTGPIFIMGRSLGSAPALELGAQRSADVAGLILESAFAYGIPLLELLGVRIENRDMVEKKVFGHLQKIKTFQKPVLILHAEFDHIIPVSDGEALFESCPSEYKSFVQIDGADHNDIFFRGRSKYMNAMSTFCNNG